MQPSRTLTVMVISPFQQQHRTERERGLCDGDGSVACLHRARRGPAPPVHNPDSRELKTARMTPSWVRKRTRFRARREANGLIGTVRASKRPVKKRAFSRHEGAVNSLPMPPPSQLVLKGAVHERRSVLPFLREPFRQRPDRSSTLGDVAESLRAPAHGRAGSRRAKPDELRSRLDERRPWTQGLGSQPHSSRKCH